MNKKDLRAIYKSKRQELNENQIQEMSLAIANQVLKLDIWDKTYFHVFLPIESKNEVNTEYILHVLQAKDKEIVVSKSNFDTLQMTHFLLTNNTKIIKNNYEIPEPVDGIEVPSNKIQIVFVPLLAFDKMGNRVGYGKGFYDKFLKGCKINVIKIGLSFFEPTTDLIPILETDIKLDYCVTPFYIYDFSK